MPTVSEQLRSLYLPEQLTAMEKVRDRMLDDPTLLDNHSKKDAPDAIGEELE